MIRFAVIFIGCTLIGYIIGSIGKASGWSPFSTLLLSLLASVIFSLTFSISMESAKKADEESNER